MTLPATRTSGNGVGPVVPADWGIEPIDWPSFWTAEVEREDFILEPLVPAGRSTAVYSPAKEGKSLLVLDSVAAAATGRPVLGRHRVEPFDIVYVDLEMTRADLRERLGDLGYGPGDDLSRLHYFQLQDLPPLDTEEGGQVLLAVAQEHQARLVVIDTMARAVRGEENSADTFRNFYACTGRRLKAGGIALLRLDHQGKDGSLGQRGSSAKVDDVDVVFKLTAEGRHIVLTRTHSRVPWIPAEVVITRMDDPVLHHVLDGAQHWPAGTSDCALVLDELGVPLDATANTAQTALRRVDKGRAKAVICAALNYRRQVP